MTQHLSSKVIWKEGMALTPHHFQLQSRYFESAIRAVMGYLCTDAWGFACLEIDREALAQGEILVTAAEGVMPDGTAFSIPELGSAGLRLTLRDEWFETESLEIYLTLPAYRVNGPNVSTPRAGQSAAGRLRYFPETREIADETSEADRQQIQLGRKDFALKARAQLTKDEVSIRLSRILSRDGKYSVDAGAVPPSLRIGAFRCVKGADEKAVTANPGSAPQVSAITGMARDLATELSEKARILTRQRRSMPTGVLTLRSLGTFWLLQTLQRSLSQLRYFIENPDEHPALLYRELLRLSGGLCTFSADSDPAGFPPYVHRDPGPGFRALAAHIRRHLELNLPTNCFEITLEAFDDYYFRGRVDDARFRPESRWVLGIRSPLPESQLRATAPRVVKISSHDFIKRAVERLVAEVPLRPIDPPGEIDPRPGWRYFAVDATHTDFEAVFSRKGIGIYVPGSVRPVELSLHVMM